MFVIKEAVLHILDKNAGNLLLSDRLLDLEDGYIQDYINKLVAKVMQSDIKTAILEPNHAIYPALMDPDLDLLDKSRDLAAKIYDLIAPAENIPAADYLFFRGRDDLEGPVFGILRLDYQTSYTHFLSVEEGMYNQLIQNHAILPQPGQKPTEAFIFNQGTMTYALLEKAYEIEGEKTFYFSEKLLGILPPSPTPTHIKQIRKTLGSVAKRFDEPVYEKMAMAQKVIYQQLEDSDQIEADLVLEKVFEHNAGALSSAKEDLAQLEVPAQIKVTNVPKYEKKYAKQKFKLANGIELSIPIDLYDDKDIIEFINQPDGSISVLIKNVEAIVNKFNG
ncbi:TPA: nucleoid-associated protein [Streptococcus suis]